MQNYGYCVSISTVTLSGVVWHANTCCG